MFQWNNHYITVSYQVLNLIITLKNSDCIWAYITLVYHTSASMFIYCIVGLLRYINSVNFMDVIDSWNLSPQKYLTKKLEYYIIWQHAHSPHWDKECSHLGMIEVQSCIRDHQCHFVCRSTKLVRESRNSKDPYVHTVLACCMNYASNHVMN